MTLIFLYTRGRKGWRSSESIRLPPMWLGFKSWRRRHNVGWVCCCFSLLLREVFLRVLRFSLSPQKPTFPNSNSTRIQVDEEPLCGCATSKSLFYLFIIIKSVVWINFMIWLLGNLSRDCISRLSLVCQLLTTKHKLIFKITRTLVVSWQTKSSKRYTDFKVKKNVEP